MGICASEFTDNWSFFLSHFHRTFTFIDGVKVTIISDWSKGLDATLAGELIQFMHTAINTYARILWNYIQEAKFETCCERLCEFEVRFSLKNVLRQFRSCMQLQQNIFSKFYLSIGQNMLFQTHDMTILSPILQNQSTSHSWISESCQSLQPCEVYEIIWWKNSIITKSQL